MEKGSGERGAYGGFGCFMAIGDDFGRSLTFGLGFEPGESLGVDITDEESLVRTQSSTQVLCHGIPHDPEA